MPGVTAPSGQHASLWCESEAAWDGRTFPGLEQMAMRLVQRLAEAELCRGDVQAPPSPDARGRATYPRGSHRPAPDHGNGGRHDAPPGWPHGFSAYALGRDR
jgi:hypothetical protein